MKACPFCREQVHDDAIKCCHCQSLLIPLQEGEKPDSNRITYVVDRDLVRFAKFAGGLLSVFLVIGAYFFGFRLEDALEKARDTQEKITKAQNEVTLALKDVQATQKSVNELKKRCEAMLEAMLRNAESKVTSISEQQQQAIQMVINLRNQPQLDSEGRARIEEARAKQPDSFRGAPGSNFWKSGTTISVRFLDGSPALQDRVKKVAMNWTMSANLTFQFTDKEEADIRISFKEPGHWSFCGTECLAISKSMPTMNFEFPTDDIADSELKAVVLHEFGHVLGLVEEYQNPKASILWNREAVFSALTGPPYNMPKEYIERGFLSTLSEGQLPDYRDFDPTSIMMIAIPKEWTTNGVEVQRPMDLSASDKRLVARLYPK